MKKITNFLSMVIIICMVGLITCLMIGTLDENFFNFNSNPSNYEFLFSVVVAYMAGFACSLVACLLYLFNENGKYIRYLRLAANTIFICAIFSSMMAEYFPVDLNSHIVIPTIIFASAIIISMFSFGMIVLLKNRKRDNIDHRKFVLPE